MAPNDAAELAWQARLDQARALRRQGDARAAIAGTTALLDEALSLGTRVKALLLRAAAFGDAGEAEAMYTDLQTARRTADGADLPGWVARSSALAATTALDLGRVSHALDHAVDALVAAQDPRVELEDHLSAAASLGILFTHMGAPGASAQILESAWKRALPLRELPWVAYVTLVNLAHALSQVAPLLDGEDRLDTAERAVRANERVIAAEAAGAVCRDAARANHAVLLAWLGRTTQAQSQLDALESDPSTLAAYTVATIHRARGHIALAQDQPVLARASLDQAADRFAKAGLRLDEAAVLELRASAHEALGDVPAALADLRLALARCRISRHDGIERLTAQVFTRAEDVQQRRTMADAARSLEEANLKDPLTGLGNRRRWERLVAERAGQRVGLLLCDLDRFKTVNDDFGHDTGDAVLRRASAVLSDTVRANDVVIRWGGEEFLIVAPTDQTAGVQRLAERLRDAVARTGWDDLLKDGRGQTMSIGVATGALDDAGLVTRADEALYAAKRAGRNRVVTAD